MDDGNQNTLIAKISLRSSVLYFDEPEGDTLSPVDNGNGRLDPPRPFSPSLSLSLSVPLSTSSYIPLLHGSARPVLPWQQEPVQHRED